MIYHVLPGDAQVAEFIKSQIKGEVIVFREALISGPILAESLDIFFEQRARYVLAEYAEDEIVYHEKVADEITRLVDVDAVDEINLWFEYELFCSVNYWFCLSLLANTGADVYRVEPIGLEDENRWDGFGKFTADDLLASFELRTRLTDDDIRLGASLWRAYAKDDHAALRELGKKATTAFPFLNEIVDAAIEQGVRPLEVVRSIMAGEEKDFAAIFVQYKERAGEYGYGDVQLERLIDKVSLA